MIDIETNKFLYYLLFFYGMLFIPSFHLFYKPKFLIVEKYYKIVLTFLILVLLASIILYLYNQISPSILFLLSAPIYQLFLYRVSYYIFVKKYKHLPRDVAFNLKDEFWADRVFSILYMCVAIIPVVITAGIVKNIYD